jgi:hypothetical protein
MIQRGIQLSKRHAEERRKLRTVKEKQQQVGAALQLKIVATSRWLVISHRMTPLRERRG